MSRTFRRDESGRKSQDTRRAKRREKANSHFDNPHTERQEHHRKQRYSDKINYIDNWLDSDTD